MNPSIQKAASKIYKFFKRLLRKRYTEYIELKDKERNAYMEEKKKVAEKRGKEKAHNKFRLI